LKKVLAAASVVAALVPLATDNALLANDSREAGAEHTIELANLIMEDPAPGVPRLSMLAPAGFSSGDPVDSFVHFHEGSSFHEGFSAVVPEPIGTGFGSAAVEGVIGTGPPTSQALMTFIGRGGPADAKAVTPDETPLAAAPARTAAAVPEPSTWLAMLVGFFGLGAAIRRKRASGRVDVAYA
jgi:hypothetical protein